MKPAPLAREPMTSVGADKTFAEKGAGLVGDPKSPPLGEGDRIGEKYEVIRVLGSGGMAVVVEAKNVEGGEVVALKFLRPEFLVDKDLVERFALAARAASKIENEHVACVLDVGAMPDGAPFIVREYLEGKDLGALVREEGTAPVECACEFLLQACEGLAAAHALGIVHRDIKPENLFLARSTQGLDVIKLLDFGISKLALYMSPEQIRASSDLDARTDIWSLGCVLYELLMGHAPFEAASITLLTASILERPSPSLQERSDVPGELQAVVSRCLAKDPGRRFQTVSELAAALYPFAPRRARLSVERCSQILRHAGLKPVPVVQSTIPPPGKVPTDLAATLQTSALVASRTSDEPTHVDVSTHVDLPLPARALAPRWKAALWVAICMLVAAGAFAARPLVDAMLASTTPIVHQASATAVPAAAPGTANVDSHAAAMADFSRPSISPEVDALDSKTPPAGSAAPKPKSRKSRKGNSQTSAPEEIDVGF